MNLRTRKESFFCTSKFLDQFPWWSAVLLLGINLPKGKLILWETLIPDVLNVGDYKFIFISFLFLDQKKKKYYTNVSKVIILCLVKYAKGFLA